MSSVTRTSFSSSQPHEHTNKKKFGKNLNKLTKPPAPPIASEGKSTSRNGLLLLSTKRASAGSGLLSKPLSKQPLPSLGLQYESSTSTHDVLLGAVVGASRTEQQPDAWGVADKKEEVLVVHSPVPVSPVAHPHSHPHQHPHPNPHQNPHPHSNSSRLPSSYANNEKKEAENTNLSWDDYGGRSSSAKSPHRYDAVAPRSHSYDHGDQSHGNQSDDHDEQGAYMAKLAKERAERRRREEVSRDQEQKERASQRLRELEHKIAKENSATDLSPVMLETLGSTPVKPPTERLVRTLYDPNRTYSSLVGGALVGNNGSVGSTGVNNARVGASSGVGTTSEDTKEASRRSNSASEKTAILPTSDNLAYSGPVIHLSSYEDRDRGERNSSAGPRMLYDPKSGSMVAVPAREEHVPGRGGRKDRKKGRKEEGEKEKKKSKSRNAPSRGKPDSGSKSEKRKATLKNEKRLPRTCGVLYARDEKGACFCADGCDGDLGYGAHSVPGGRVRNADAYTSFTDRQQHIYTQEEVAEDFLYSSGASGAGGTFESEQNKPDNSLQTGFSLPLPEKEKVDWVKPNEKIELITGGDESPTLQASAREWAPSQAALAAAAAAAEKLKDEASATMTGIQSIGSQDIDDEEGSDDDAPSFMGLGFDPTENMDSVIQSPLHSSEPTTKLDSVNLGALSLDPPLCATNSRHIFAFGSAATWGSSDAPKATWGSNDAPGNNDWGAPIGSNGKKFNTEIFKENEEKAATFLSLASTSSWGATGVSALGGEASGINDHGD